MKLKKTFIPIFFSLLIMLQGCSLLKITGQKPSNKITGRAGSPTLFDFTENYRDILETRHHFEIFRSDITQEYIYVETSWKYRAPHDDEIEQGIVGTRTRIILRGNPRIKRVSTSLWPIQFTAEREVYPADGEEWIALPLTDTASGRLREIMADLRYVFDQGVRKY